MKQPYYTRRDASPLKPFVPFYAGREAVPAKPSLTAVVMFLFPIYLGVICVLAGAG